MKPFFWLYVRLSRISRALFLESHSLQPRSVSGVLFFNLAGKNGPFGAHRMIFPTPSYWGTSGELVWHIFTRGCVDGPSGTVNVGLLVSIDTGTLKPCTSAHDAVVQCDWAG